MKGRTVLHWVGGGLLALAVLLILGWLAFVPTAKEPPYEFVAAWGGKGSGPGRFHDPTGIAVTAGEVFVSDARNGRIQVFDHDGRFQRQFGSGGELQRPMNLDIAGDELYVADYWNDRLQVYGLDGTPRRTIGRHGAAPGEMNAPGGVAVAPNGDLFVADFYNQRIQQLNPEGRFIRQWGVTGQVGSGAGKFNYPTDVTLAADGTLYVADGYNDRIQAFAPDGRYARKWGGPFAMNVHGPFNGWFATVTSLAQDRQGNVFAADFYNHRIQKFAPDGTFLTTFGGKGSGPGRFNYSIAVAVAPDDTVFAVDFGNHRIQKWRPGKVVTADARRSAPRGLPEPGRIGRYKLVRVSGPLGEGSPHPGADGRAG